MEAGKIGLHFLPPKRQPCPDRVLFLNGNPPPKMQAEGLNIAAGGLVTSASLSAVLPPFLPNPDPRQRQKESRVKQQATGGRSGALRITPSRRCGFVLYGPTRSRRIGFPTGPIESSFDAVRCFFCASDCFFLEGLEGALLSHTRGTVPLQKTLHTNFFSFRAKARVPSRNSVGYCWAGCEVMGARIL